LPRAGFITASGWRRTGRPARRAGPPPVTSAFSGRGRGVPSAAAALGCLGVGLSGDGAPLRGYETSSLVGTHSLVLAGPHPRSLALGGKRLALAAGALPTVY